MILVVDFGSQTAHLIGRRLRDLGVEVEYVDPDEVIEKVKKYKPTGLILSGGPSSVYEDGAPTMDKLVFDLGLPVLGICYGWQLMAKFLGGNVESATKEYGPEELVVTDNSLLLQDTNSRMVWMSHGDSVTELPRGFAVVASTKKVVNTLTQNAEKKLFGTQFHPEVEHTEGGEEIIKAFAVEVCGEKLSPLVLDPNKIIESIRKEVGDRQVICAVSGGVDSTVAAFLMGKAIGKQLIPVYIKSGLMRLGNDESVGEIFRDLVDADLVVIEAEERFMNVLRGIDDPEMKRKIIGKLYVDLFQEQASKYPNVSFLGQGTIYSDVIESKGSKHASKIKSHHNVGGLPKELGLKLLEPLRGFYKDEVRKIGKMAGLSDELVMQHPFPGPGYAIRIRGEVSRERLEQVKIADLIVEEEMKRAGLYHKVFQCFALMTGAYSTAVKGDARVFAEVVGIRAYESKDVMTSQWAQLPYEVLQRISTRIVNEVPDVSRVVYDITTKPPATMEWE